MKKESKIDLKRSINVLYVEPGGGYYSTYNKDTIYANFPNDKSSIDSLDQLLKQIENSNIRKTRAQWD